MQSLNRTLFISDNLPVLRGIDSESIDLIATDPPFNKGVKAFEGITAAGENISYKDVWTWSDVQQEWWNTIREEHRNLYEVIDAANHAAGDDMGAFLCWLGVRVLEMRRVLKPTGSLYLHCDSTASAWLKAMLDAVFGAGQFRNMLVWNRARGKGLNPTRYVRNCDQILYYSNGGKPVWNQQHEPFEPGYGDDWRKDELGAWESADLTGGRAGGPEAYLPFKGALPSPGRAWAPPARSKFPVQGQRRLPDDYESLNQLEKCEALDAAGLIHWPRNGRPRYKKYLSTLKGRYVSDLISDTPPVHAHAKERTGYPTQKPLALYERLIKASSNPGDLVLDPFAGCATTAIAAERLGRGWVAIDLNEPAEKIIRERLEREAQLPVDNDSWDRAIHVTTDPPERTDDGDAVAPELVVVSRKRSAPRMSRREVREHLMLSDGMRCQGCGWVPPYLDYLQVDHKKPRSLGGVDEMDNFALLCDPCNRLKSNKLTLAELRLLRSEEGRMDAGWWQEERWR